jgi:hypothetical protein
LLIGRHRHSHHPPKPSAESRDLEDLIAVVEGRATLVTEVQAETVELRAYVRAEINRLLAKAGFLDGDQIVLPPDWLLFHTYFMKKS